MPQRIFNLTILASWLFAWSSAALHHHSHECHHEQAESAAHDEVSHCGHNHHHDAPAKKAPSEKESDTRSWDVECRLCEIQAIPFDAPQPATLASVEPMPSPAVRLSAAEPTVEPPRRWNGRAPPLSS